MSFIHWKAKGYDVIFALIVMAIGSGLFSNLTGCTERTWIKQAIKHGYTTGHESK